MGTGKRDGERRKGVGRGTRISMKSMSNEDEIEDAASICSLYTPVCKHDASTS